MLTARPATTLASFFLTLSASVVAGQPSEDYRLLPDRVVIADSTHWQSWTAPAGVRVIEADGTVRPRRLVDEFDATANASDFTYSLLQDADEVSRGGIGMAGTNADSALHVIDDDPTTYWEPDRDDDLEDWFIEVDLGRALVVTRVELRFVDEGQGDPFLKFRVLVSDGLPNFDDEKTYSRVGLVSAPNKETRRFVFDVEPTRPVPEGIEGEITQFVRIDVLDSDGPRAEVVTAAAYLDLPEADRGAIDHFRTTSSGRLLLVSQDVWEQLPEQLRGPVRHYRHERPRLAEVRVFALGENVVGLTQRERQRDLDEGGFDYFLFQTFTDGLYSSWFPMRPYDVLRDLNQVGIDLGARYWLNRIKLLAPQSPPQLYQVRISDGALDPSGDLVWSTFPERSNPAEFQHVQESFPTQKVRYIEVRRLAFSGVEQEEGNLSEIQAYGEGFVSDVSMVSDFIRLGRQRLITQLDWEGEVPPGTRVEISTRSGDEIVQIPHYFAITGREISRELWERIPESVRTEPVIEEVPGADWSNWSEPYAAASEAFRSPTPSRNVLARVRLISDEPLRAASISSLQLRFRPPLVDKILAEIDPSFGVEPGVDREFTLYFRPTFVAANPGFDVARLRSSSSAAVTPVRVVRGTDASVRFATAPVLWAADGSGNGQVSVEAAAGGFDMRFRDTVRPVTGAALYAVTFRTRVFLQSTTFGLQVERDSLPGVTQSASDGDASEVAPGRGLAVVSDLEGVPLLDELTLSTTTCTPNGDGVNDEVRIDVAIFHVEGDKELAVEVYDISGRRVRDLTRHTAQPSGDHRFLWDGRDDAGRRLPPGHYVVRAAFRAEGTTGTVARLRLVGLVY